MAHSDSLQGHVQTLLSPSRDLSQHLAQLAGKRVLLRADLNVPIDSQGRISDDTRIRAVLPTLTLLLQAQARVIVISHLGRPEPSTQSWDEMKAQYSLAPVAAALAEHLGSSVFLGLVPDCLGREVEGAVARLQRGQACLLENTRFYEGDVKNDASFAKALGSFADIYVCDAFGVVHRDQASVTGVIAHVPASFPGPLIRHELTFLMRHLQEPVKPLCVVIGGAKVADKIGVLWSLIPRADVILIGGRMAFTFLAALGVSVGATQVETDRLKDAAEMLQLAKRHRVQLLLPRDVRVSQSLSNEEDISTTVLTASCCSPEQPCIPQGRYGVDIGPASEAMFCDALAHCQTIFWNGPMGKFEVPGFASGTNALAAAIAAATSSGAVTIVGGGDSAAAVAQLGLASSFSHISTGGGASLELLEGKTLPGLAALAAARVFE